MDSASLLQGVNGMVTLNTLGHILLGRDVIIMLLTAEGYMSEIILNIFSNAAPAFRNINKIQLNNIASFVSRTFNIKRFFKYHTCQ